ncbi:beta-glucanase, partial [Clostridium perfringens]
MKVFRKSISRKAAVLFCAALLILPAGMSLAANKPFPPHTSYT